MKHIINTDKKPFCPNGWEVVEHRKAGKLEWNPEKVRLHSEPEQEKGYLNGNTLRERLKDKPVLNANVLDYLLKHTELIPEDWKDKYVYFWGTIYRDSGGHLSVRCLGWSGDRWGWSFNWLGHDWYGGHPAAVSAGVEKEVVLDSLTLSFGGKRYKAVGKIKLEELK